MISTFNHELCLDQADTWLQEAQAQARTCSNLDQDYLEPLAIFNIHHLDPVYRSLVLTVYGDFLKLKPTTTCLLDRWLRDQACICSYKSYKAFFRLQAQRENPKARIRLPYVLGQICWVEHPNPDGAQPHFFQLTDCLKLDIWSENLAQTNRATIRMVLPFKTKLPALEVYQTVTSTRLYRYYGAIPDLQVKAHTALLKQMQDLGCSGNIRWQHDHAYNKAFNSLKAYFHILPWITVDDYCQIEAFHLLQETFLGSHQHPALKALNDILLKEGLDMKALSEIRKIWQEE